ncbi:MULTISPECIES: hypothetical protein [unclassified Variovorax]|uniref:hypothetical protein n=1 Tax=unclassified Variovorax TaxID=663243 RepID=UPI0008C613B7|nr:MULTISPECIES: hypothetical protein [unclassified Variovorax]SEK15764.1 hypothetical protein SAMN05518853_11912 [Variovorax sp. OK202]SFE21124.1 hypothetical protein SAMN05444746_11912 [Variovorax sp. OK212]
MTRLHLAFTAIKPCMKMLVVLGLAFGGLYMAGKTVATRMPELRVSVSMGHGILAPKFISFVGGV